MLICSYLNEYVKIADQTGDVRQKLTMFYEFRLIANFVGKYECMSTDFFTYFPEPLGKYQPNLAQVVLGLKELNLYN